MKTSPETAGPATAGSADGVAAADDSGGGAPMLRSAGTAGRKGARDDARDRRDRREGPDGRGGRPGHAGHAGWRARLSAAEARVDEVVVPVVPSECPPPLGRAWALPEGPGCARYARSVLAEALAEAGASRAAIADAKLMASELATNAHQHAADRGPHELWLYAGGASGGELRCAVFDRDAAARLPGYSWTSGDYGRGLSIVQELSEGRWGMLRTMSRCLPRARGKAVWFTVPAAVQLPADLLRAPYRAVVPAPAPAPPPLG
ncbi:ATP-binding protein [Actinomadura rugatobispora]|uniref:ATP-binding protein n=1 Tax=Actinomadura rugatobispora TaxID=1994 RepID=A0ABW0ZUH2_9ACTN